MISKIPMKKPYNIVVDRDLLNFDEYYYYINMKYPLLVGLELEGWTDMLTFPYEVQDHDRLRGLSLAIYTLKQLTNNKYADIIDIASKYDHDEKFIMSVIEFLKDIGWLSQDENGKYIITEQGIKEVSFLIDSKQS